MGTSLHVVVTASAYVLVATICSAQPARYRVTELPFCAYDINNQGQVIGAADSENGATAVVWSATTGIVDIGAAAGFYASVAYGINKDGQVTGIHSYTPTPPFTNGFFWDPVSGAVDLPDLPGGDTYAAGQSIAAGGRVAGFSIAESGGRAVLWTPGSPWTSTDLGDLPGGTDGSWAAGLNDAGHVVGYSSATAGNRAFLWTPEHGMVSLSTLPGLSFVSLAYDINSADAVVGYSASSPITTHAFLWTPSGGMVDLGELPGGQEMGIAYALNDARQVVGYSTVSVPAGDDPGRAFLWEEGTMYDLNALVDSSDPLKGILLLTQAHGINESGQIVGCATNQSTGNASGFLLTPIPVLKDLSLKMTVVAGCKAVMGSVTLFDPAPSGGFTVRFTDTLASASTPVQVKIPAGATTKSFSIKTTPVMSEETGTITATLRGTALARNLTVRPMGTSSVALTPNPVIGGNLVTGTAKLECKAGPDSVRVHLTSTNPSVANPTAAYVDVPTGIQSITFDVATTPISSKVRAQIQATANGITKQRVLTVLPPVE